MRKLIVGAAALALLALGSISLPEAIITPVRAQQVLLPIPSAMCTADQLAVAYDTNNLYCKTVVLEATGTVGAQSISASQCAAMVIDVSGALTTDRVVAHPPSANTYLVSMPRPGSTDGSVIIDFCNVNTSARNTTGGTWTFTLIRNP